MGTRLTVPVDGTRMDVDLAEPEGAARGAIIVLQEAFGVNPHIRDVAGRFAAEGYVAAAPHLFHRSGDPELGYDDIEPVRPHLAALRPDEVDADLRATLRALDARGHPSRRVATVGFCMGGTLSFVAACRWALGAAVTFYGGGIAAGRFGFPSQLELAPSLQTPWLGFYGDLDAGIPSADVDRLERATAEAVVPTEVVRYPGADHGFHCDARSSHHPPSAEDAWARTLVFLDRHLA